MNKKRKEELIQAIYEALKNKKATNGEVIQLLGQTWFWSLRFSRYENIELHGLPEGKEEMLQKNMRAKFTAQ